MVNLGSLPPPPKFAVGDVVRRWSAVPPRSGRVTGRVQGAPGASATWAYVVACPRVDGLGDDLVTCAESMLEPGEWSEEATVKDARPGLPAYPAETVQCPKCGNAWKRDGLTVRYVDASAARRHAGSLGGATSVIGEHASYQEHRDRFTWPEDGWLYWECARCHYGWETRTLT